jgi:hypothetical protein
MTRRRDDRNDERGVVIVEFALLMAFVGILAVPAIFLVLDIIAKGELSTRAPAVAQLLASNDQSAPWASGCNPGGPTQEMWCEVQAIVGEPLGTSGYTVTVNCFTAQGGFCSGASGVTVDIEVTSIWKTPILPLPQHLSETAEYVDPLEAQATLSFKPFVGTVTGSSESLKQN